MNVHSIDIERCTECPFIDWHTGQDRSVRCTHPNKLAFERLEVDPDAKPPKHCPLRIKPNLLRVTS